MLSLFFPNFWPSISHNAQSQYCSSQLERIPTWIPTIPTVYKLFFGTHYEKVADPANMTLHRYYSHTKNNKLIKEWNKLVTFSMSSEGLRENSNSNCMSDFLVYILHVFILSVCACNYKQGYGRSETTSSIQNFIVWFQTDNGIRVVIPQYLNTLFI